VAAQGVEPHLHPQPEGSGEGLYLLPPTFPLVPVEGLGKVSMHARAETRGAWHVGLVEPGRGSAVTFRRGGNPLVGLRLSGSRPFHDWQCRAAWRRWQVQGPSCLRERWLSDQYTVVNGCSRPDGLMQKLKIKREWLAGWRLQNRPRLAEGCCSRS
jgi:hypothetical protein